MDDNRLDGQSFDNIRARIEELKRMFPEAVSEGRLDYDTLMALLGDEFDNENEKYQFTWKGKLNALKLAQKRSSGTLRPDFQESHDWETTGNLYIEGDNLEVLKLLQQGYLRKVKMIYIEIIMSSLIQFNDCLFGRSRCVRFSSRRVYFQNRWVLKRGVTKCA